MDKWASRASGANTTWDVAFVHARLRALAEADPEFRRFGSKRHRYRPGPVLSEGEVAAFETRHDIRLPEDFRGFLLQLGDGGAGPYYGLIRLDGSGVCHPDLAERHIPGLLATPFPHTGDSWNPVDELDEDAYFDPCWTAGSLLIAEFGCGAFFRLVVSGPAHGQIWFDDRASDGGLSRVADCFHDWYMAWLTDPRP